MPITQLVDFKRINLEETQFELDEIIQYIPHRYEMLQIDRIVTLNPEEGYTVGIKEVRDDEFWVRGHIPGRPILPGVLLMEASAQLCTFHFRKCIDSNPEKFFGYAKVKEVRFRGTAAPGDLVVLVVKLLKNKPSVALFATQAFVEGSLIFEAEIMGTSV